jgi:PAS domain S-box-containing protein
MKHEGPRTAETVWIIDDDETALLLAQAVLADAGFAVRTFIHAAEALSAAQKGIPALIVVDVIMPEMDGFEFCTRLRELPEGALVPILVTTSLDDTASIDKAYQAGATNFATKPLNWTIEVHRLDYMLRSARIARDLLQKEQETRLAKEDWERTFDSITDAVTVLDMDLRILRANKATSKLTGGYQGEVLGRHCYELFQGNKEKCLDCPASRVQATDQPASAEVKCGRAGKLFEITVSPVTDAQGRTTHLVHVARDLSEKKELEAELRHAQKMEAVGTLAGGIAHDFNNLLTVIQCCAEMEIADEAESSRTSDNLETILQTTQRGADLTKQLLVFSRKKPNASQIHLVNLNEVLQNLGRMLGKGLVKTLTQTYRLAPGLHKISADSSQIEQVVMNLAVNAAHAMPKGGTLTVETRNLHLDAEYCRSHPDLQPGEYVLLTVADTGHGMDKATLARIYEPFFTTKGVGEGTGLGLAVVFGIVREHHGHITCESEVGVGTVFRIYLPAASPSVFEAQETVAASQAIPGGSETILVVDDEAHIRTLLERHLTKLGYRVITAADGEIALRRYSDDQYRTQAVILDLGMPNMSGWDCLEKLKGLNPQVKVLVASGYGGADLDTRVKEKGATAFMHKPYNLTALSLMLREVLDAPANAVV